MTTFCVKTDQDLIWQIDENFLKLQMIKSKQKLIILMQLIYILLI